MNKPFTKVSVDAIDALLPQHQCGLCQHSACRPYAEALADGQDHIGRCPPGGVETLQKLADLLEQDPSPYVTSIQAQHKQQSVAVIREAECIGCTKCIQVCPTDAIIGTGKYMHTVIRDACTGCELCVPACPVDCIDLLAVDYTVEQEKQYANEWRERYQRRQARLPKKKPSNETPLLNTASNQTQRQADIADRQVAIKAAVKRVQQKKSQANDPLYN